MTAARQPRSPRTLPRATLAVLLAATCALAGLRWSGRLDRTAPRLSWTPTAPQVAVSGTLHIVVGARDDRPGLGALELTVDGRRVADIGDAQRVSPGGEASAGGAGGVADREMPVYAVDLDTSDFDEGPHTVAITAADRALPANRATVAWTLVFDRTPPALTVPPGPLAVRQGGVIAAVIEADEPLAEAAATIGDRTVPLYPLDGPRRWRLLAGVGVDEGADGGLTATVEAADDAGNTSVATIAVQVEQVDWPRGGYVALSPGQERAQSEEARRHTAREKRRAAYATAEPRQLWSGPFVRPAPGPVTSPFGKVREYSTGLRRHHLGLDIANAPGTPVVAAAPGVVVLAEELAIYGNAVIVGHGQGVFTSYNHLQTIAVAVGERVQRGQLVGTMGSTGQSTGSHLHWGMVVGGLAVDPRPWLERELAASP